MKKGNPPGRKQSESRRDFLKKGALAASAVMAGYTSSAAGAARPRPRRYTAPAPGSVLGANDRLNIGFIGVGGQGFSAHVRTIANISGADQPFHEHTYNAVGVATCDLYSGYRERARDLLVKARDAQGLGSMDVDMYEDYRAILDRQDIDAVFIGTVDHWHAQIAVDAMEAGKHVYCEKPMTRYLGEAFAIYDSVQKTGKKFQIGSQYCTEAKWHQAAELVRAGAIGPLVVAQHSYMRNTPDGEWNYYELDEGVTPETMNWEKWLGSVSRRIPFNREHYHRWRKYYPYCCGILGDLLAHVIHPLLIATGNPEFPRRVACLGNKQITNSTVGPQDRDVNDQTQVLADFPSGLGIIVMGATVNEQGLGTVIRGNEGTLYLGSDSVELRPERPFADLVDQAQYEGLEPGPNIPDHVANWFDAIRNDGTPNGNIDVAIRAQTIITLAEMSERLGEMLHFDEATRKVTGGSGREIEPITYGTLELS
jgi:predicted dehydrogenase